ncbi:MAG: hypothetical protein JWM99_3357 [Verrucomicrobiales bacterium]|nr:hypothetical protein [Verrucomicrobiales bacterium]
MPELSNSERIHFSADGSLLGSTTGSELRIWSMKGATLVSIGEMAKDVTDFEFLATKVVTFDRENSAVRLWDLDSGELIRKIEIPLGNYTWAVTPSGSHLALAVLKEIYVYDFGGPGLRIFSGHTDFVEALAFSADGKMLASGTGWGGNTSDLTVRLWNVETGQQIKAIPAPGNGAASLAFAPKSLVLAGAAFSGESMVWRVEDSQVVESLKLEPYSELTFSADGKSLASGGYVLDMETGNVADVIGHRASIQNLRFTRDSSRLISDDGARIHVWDSTVGKSVVTLDKSSPVTGASAKTSIRVVAHNSAYLMRLADALDVSADNKTLLWGGRLWSLESGLLTRIFATNFLEWPRTISPNWDVYVTEQWGTNIAILRDMTNGAVIHQLWRTNAYESRVQAFSPDGLLVATTGGFLRSGYDIPDRTVSVWDSRTGTLVKEFNGQTSDPYAICFSANQKYIAAIGERNDGVATVWNFDTGEVALRLIVHDPRAAAFAFFPNSELVAWGHDGGLEIWNIAGSNLVRSVTTTDTKYTSALAVSPDGRKLAVGRMDGAVSVFDLPWRETLAIQSDGGGIIVAFPKRAGMNYALQSSRDLTSWITVTNWPAAVASSDAQIKIQSAGSAQFFQLLQE